MPAELTVFHFADQRENRRGLDRIDRREEFLMSDVSTDQAAADKLAQPVPSRRVRDLRALSIEGVLVCGRGELLKQGLRVGLPDTDPEIDEDVEEGREE